MDLGLLTPELREAEIHRGAALLASIPGVKRVWIFGRAARSECRLDWRSDLDFAVEGLPPSRHGGTWADLDTALTVPVDLVLWEESDPLLRSEILKGRLLYEA